MNFTSTFNNLLSKSYFEICKNDLQLLLSIYYNNKVYNYDILKSTIEVFTNFNKVNNEIFKILSKIDNNQLDKYKNEIYANDCLFIKQTKNMIITIILSYIMHHKHNNNVKIKYALNKANKLLNEIRKN
jgi:hypothetical protein